MFDLHLSPFVFSAAMCVCFELLGDAENINNEFELKNKNGWRHKSKLIKPSTKIKQLDSNPMSDEEEYL